MQGDVARMMFYMAVRYEGNENEPDLELTDSLQHKSSKVPVHARLSVLLEWHEADPVDSLEIRRNDIIYEYQRNRNPFIDRPEYVGILWGSGDK